MVSSVLSVEEVSPVLTSSTSFVPTEGLPFFSVLLDEHRVIGAMPGALLEQVTYDPRRIENPKAAEFDSRLRDIAPLRQDVQRLFEGVKKRNVPSYAAYIEEVELGTRMGVTPPIILWTPDRLKVTSVGEMGLVIATIPFGHLLVPIDGETQLAARYAAWERNSDIRKQPVAVVLAHGLPSSWARQGFHDLNVYGSRPNAAIAISMDAYDPATEIARRIEREVEFLSGAVNKVRRQLRKSDRNNGDVMTVTALRGSIVTLARGISGVAVGARGVDIKGADRERVYAVAVAWWDALGEHLGHEISSPESVASAPATIAALGAIGHELVERFEVLSPSGALVDAAEDLARDLADDVDWSKGDHWAGIAGKFTPAGRFAIGGAKETAYAIYDALTNPSSRGYKAVRQAASA